MFISPAYAQAAAEGSGLDLMSFVPLVVIFVVFYYLLFRPQQQKAKQHKKMVSSLRRGDRIVTQSGFIGSVAKVINNVEMLVDLGENVRVRMLREQVAEVLDSASTIGSDDAKKDSSAIDAESEKKPEESKPSSLLARLLSKKNK